jgi:hypothetical protein
MNTNSDQEFFRVVDIAERDLDYITELRERIAANTSDTSSDAKDAVRRLYVRVFITMVESSVSTIKHEVLQYPELLTDTERAVLRDVTYDLNDKGEPYERPLHPPFLASLKFALRMFAKVHQLKTMPNYSDHGWQAMQDVVRIRNRLTHPKTVGDLKVTSADLKAVDVAEVWFLRTHGALVEEFRKALEKELDSARARSGA